MSIADPFALLFAGMDKLGPGDDRDTLHVLSLLPRRVFPVVVDAGCGTGRQTIALAKALGTEIHAVDLSGPFLDHLARRAGGAGVGRLVRTHQMDMKDIPTAFPAIDLLWSEGAAYSIGFANALTAWAPALTPDRFAVVSELAWFHQRAPAEVREFFRTGYPQMRTVEENLAIAAEAGYRVIATHPLPGEAWVDGYYDVLGPRAKAFLDHSDPSVRALAVEMAREIEIFERSEGSYGYVFFVLQAARG